MTTAQVAETSVTVNNNTESYSGIRSPGSYPDDHTQPTYVFVMIKNIFMMKNLTDFRKTVETGVDARLLEQRKNR